MVSNECIYFLIPFRNLFLDCNGLKIKKSNDDPARVPILWLGCVLKKISNAHQ